MHDIGAPLETAGLHSFQREQIARRAALLIDTEEFLFLIR